MARPMSDLILTPEEMRDYLKDISRVMTISDAVNLAPVSKDMVEYAIDNGHIAAQRCGIMWIMSTRSFVDWYRRKYPNSHLTMGRNG